MCIVVQKHRISNGISTTRTSNKRLVGHSTGELNGIQQFSVPTPFINTITVSDLKVHSSIELLDLRQGLRINLYELLWGWQYEKDILSTNKILQKQKTPKYILFYFNNTCRFFDWLSSFFPDLIRLTSVTDWSTCSHENGRSSACLVAYECKYVFFSESIKVGKVFEICPTFTYPAYGKRGTKYLSVGQ